MGWLLPFRSEVDTPVWGLESGGVVPFRAPWCCSLRRSPHLHFVLTSLHFSFLVLSRQFCSSSTGCQSSHMIISLDRFCQSDPQDQFPLLSSVGWFYIQTLIVSALDPKDSRRFLHSCLVLFSDRSELLLWATKCRLQLSISTFAVPTPPVQIYLLPAHGQGGVWDSEVSSRSLPSSGSNAVEIQ